jgi:alpha,alpha-trehalose phosphorylase
VYTNLMAQQNLSAAAAACARHPDGAARLGVTDEETSAWLAAAQAMTIPFDAERGIHPQHESFTEHAEWDFAGTPADKYPLLLHYPYFELYRKQVIKQADLVLAMHLRGDAFTAEQKARNFAYYETLTVRDSSLSACTQAVLAAETGHLELAHDYLAETALIDLQGRQHNTRDGLYMAVLAGAWTALVAGFGGMRASGGRLAFSPRLPSGITRLAVRLRYRGRKLRLAITAGEARYELLAGDPPAITHHGEQVLLAGTPVVLGIPDFPVTLCPRQPEGRAPVPHARVPAADGRASQAVDGRRAPQAGGRCQAVGGGRSQAVGGDPPCARPQVMPWRRVQAPVAASRRNS